MKLPSLSQALLFSLLPAAWASLTTDSVLEACLTKSCITSVASVPTTTTTYTLSQIATLVIAPQVTITPATTTATVKSTTVVTSTKTLGSVKTLTSTSTAISTFSSTTTAIVTVSTLAAVTVTVTPTSTVPTSPGLVFQSDSPYDKRRRDLAPIHPHVPRSPKQVQSLTPSSEYYPSAVTCGVLVDIFGLTTSTAGKTVTVSGPTPTVKVTSTVTATVTATDCHASATVTSTTTLGVTSTVAVTITTNIDTDPTTTVTVTAATTTVYAACVSANLLTNDPEYAGGYIIGPVNVGDVSINLEPYTTVPTDNNYDCCVMCQTNGDCGGAVFDANVGLCYVVEPTSACDPTFPNESSQGVQFAGNSHSFVGITLIAGPCGQCTGT